MALNAYVGYGVSTLLLWLLNKRNKKTSSSSQTPSSLNVTDTATRLGDPIPVVLGRTLIKSPLIAYYGDFRSEPYTETYSAHANFNAGPIFLMSLLQAIILYATRPHHGTEPEAGQSHTHTITTPHGPGSASGAAPPVRVKDNQIAPWQQSIWMIFINFLLSWLINGRNLRTTMQKGFKYYLGYQYLVCWTGTDIRIKRIYMKENNVFDSVISYWENQDPTTLPPLPLPPMPPDDTSIGIINNPSGYNLDINDDHLFGGPDEQGGFIGSLHIYFGSNVQQKDAWMIQQMSQTSIQQHLRGLTPVYKPFLSIVVPTAYIGKTATIPELWVEVHNVPNNLGLGAIGEDANPSEVIYEILINQDWGCGVQPSYIDINSLITMGEKLKEEKLGISIQISNETTAGDVINSICDHIGAVKFIDPVEGKVRFKLIRDDYDIDDLIVLDETNCSFCEFVRTDWSEVLTGVTANYTEADSMYEQGSVPVYDRANQIILEGQVSIKKEDFAFFTNASNARYAAEREQMSQGYPLATVSLTANRQASNLRIGDCFILKWKPYGIGSMVFRIIEIDVGDLVDGKVQIEALEDVFSFSKTNFMFNGGSEWTETPNFPTGVQSYNFMELPYEITKSLDTYVYAMAMNPSINTTYWTTWRFL